MCYHSVQEASTGSYKPKKQCFEKDGASPPLAELRGFPCLPVCLPASINQPLPEASHAKLRQKRCTLRTSTGVCVCVG